MNKGFVRKYLWLLEDSIVHRPSGHAITFRIDYAFDGDLSLEVESLVLFFKGFISCRGNVKA